MKNLSIELENFKKILEERETRDEDFRKTDEKFFLFVLVFFTNDA